jgi:hypothetical protein
LSAQQQQQLIRFRNRFPKPQPNIGASSGLERNRRLSGHYHSTEPAPPTSTSSSIATTSTSVTTTAGEHLRTPPLTPQPAVNATIDPLSQIHSPMRHRTLSSTLVSAAIASPAPSDMILVQQQSSTSLTGVSFKQYILGQSSPATYTALTSMSQPATPYTPVPSVYNTRFPKEQIKNVIKHLAMQKLKKIESEVR